MKCAMDNVYPDMMSHTKYAKVYLWINFSYDQSTIVLD